MTLKNLILLGALVLLVSIISCDSGNALSTQKPEEVVETYLQAVSTGDIDTCFDLLADDFVFIQEPPGITIEGKAQYRSSLEQMAIWNHNVRLTSSILVDMGKVTASFTESGDDFRVIGMDSIAGSIQMFISDGKIHSITVIPNEEDWNRYIHLISGGVGIEIKPVNEGMEIVGFTLASLAPEAGLHIGDTIIAVNHINYTDMRSSEFQLRCAGAPRTNVLLTVTKPGEIRPVDIEVERIHMDRNAGAQYTITASSIHFSSGYYASLIVDNPNQTISSVEVSGPGIDGSLPLRQLQPGQWWSQPNVNLGLDPPPVPLTYTFVITNTEGTNHSIQSNIQSYVETFAEIISPAGDIVSTDKLVFSWKSVDIAEVRYQVQLNDAMGNRIWDSPRTASTSSEYAGPALATGEYKFYISTLSKSGDESLSCGSFRVK